MCFYNFDAFLPIRHTNLINSLQKKIKIKAEQAWKYVNWSKDNNKKCNRDLKRLFQQVLLHACLIKSAKYEKYNQFWQYEEHSNWKKYFDQYFLQILASTPTLKNLAQPLWENFGMPCFRFCYSFTFAYRRAVLHTFISICKCHFMKCNHLD